MNRINKINIRIIIASLWASHFLLWTFGDMLSLHQQLYEPSSNALLTFIAVPLGITQSLMIFLSLVGKAKLMRRINIGVGILFVLFNIGFFIDAHMGWEYLIGLGYMSFNLLIIRYAWKWRT